MLDQTQSPSQARHNGSAYATREGSRHAGNGSHGSNQSTAALVSQAATQISVLVRSELALAKAELAEKGKRFGMGGALLAAAGLMAGVGGALLVTLAVVLLDLVWPLWAAVLLVMGVFFLIAGLAAGFGRQQLMSASRGVPETATSVRQDLNVVKDAFHDGRHPDDRWYRYEGPAGEQSRPGATTLAGREHEGSRYGTSRYGNSRYGTSRYGRGPHDGGPHDGEQYHSSDAGWGTQIHSSDDERGKGWR